MKIVTTIGFASNIVCLISLVTVMYVFIPAVSSQTTTPAPVGKCDLQAWNDYLNQESARRSCFSRCADYGDIDKNGIPTGGTICSTSQDCEALELEDIDCKPRKLALQNKKHIFEFEKCCRKNMVELKQLKFGPPSRYAKHGVACSSMCSIYDQMTITRRRTLSKCPCEEVGYCKKSSMFWLCKELWECWGEGDEDYQMSYNTHFCNACGSTQKDELEFYEEMDCGPGAVLHKTNHTASIVLSVAAFLYNYLHYT